MANKKFILNADDFGLSNDYNRAVLYAYSRGFLTSASVCANGEAFENAMNEVLPECPELGIGVHLNIVEGKSLTKCDLLTNDEKIFNRGYLHIMMNSHNKKFLNQIENEFRAQIEKVLQYATPDHLNSHVHTHAIPEIFKITLKLAKEYNIPCVRTQYEKFYLVPELMRHVGFKYPVNILKIILLNYFTYINKKLLDGSGIKTNDYLIGVGYTGMMDDKTVEYGLAELPDENCVAEALIHPCKYSSDVRNQHMKEFLITQNKELENKIYRLGFEISNFKSV